MQEVAFMMSGPFAAARLTLLEYKLYDSNKTSFLGYHETSWSPPAPRPPPKAWGVPKHPDDFRHYLYIFPRPWLGTVEHHGWAKLNYRPPRHGTPDLPPPYPLLEHYMKPDATALPAWLPPYEDDSGVRSTTVLAFESDFPTDELRKTYAFKIFITRSDDYRPRRWNITLTQHLNAFPVRTGLIMICDFHSPIIIVLMLLIWNLKIMTSCLFYYLRHYAMIKFNGFSAPISHDCRLIDISTSISMHTMVEEEDTYAFISRARKMLRYIVNDEMMSGKPVAEDDAKVTPQISGHEHIILCLYVS